MGCCVSIDKDPPPPSFRRHSSFSNKSSSRAPPPAFEVEETVVKEVLSETHNPKSKSQHQPDDPPKKQHSLGLHEIHEPVKNNATQQKPKPITPTTEVEASEEAFSEICSTLSESVSTATFNDKPDNGVTREVRQRITDSSPSKYRNRQVSGDVKREKVVGKSPIRRSDQTSPGRIMLVNGRDQRRMVNGDNSGPVRRSRSPANRTDVGGGSLRNGVGRSPSVRKTGKSPSRVGSDLHERTRRGREPTSSTNESLENPLVSLECFIFL